MSFHAEDRPKKWCGVLDFGVFRIDIVSAAIYSVNRLSFTKSSPLQIETRLKIEQFASNIAIKILVEKFEQISLQAKTKTTISLTVLQMFSPHLRRNFAAIDLSRLLVDIHVSYFLKHPSTSIHNAFEL